MALENNNHSVFSLHYHLIFVVKYRRKIINDSISARLRDFSSTPSRRATSPWGVNDE